MSNEPNYSLYSLEELHECYKVIDKEMYPERVIQIQQQIASRENVSLTAPVSVPPPIKADTYLTPKGNWFLLHWRGQLPLVQTYWFNVFAVGLLSGALIPFFPNVLDIFSAGEIVRAVSIILLYVTITVLTIWQLVGLYRSARAHTSRGGEFGWALVAIVVMVIGSLRFAYDMAGTGVPFVIASAEVIFDSETYAPAEFRIIIGRQPAL